jgi:predicted permease
MPQLWLLFACALAGAALRATGRAPRETPAALNAICLQVALPALTLLELHRAPLQAGVGIWVAGALMPWLMFALSFGVFLTLGRRLGWSDSVTGAVVLTSGLGNTSFVGFPLLEALRGPGALPLGVVVDQLGSFPAMATVGTAAAFWFAARAGADTEKMSFSTPSPTKRGNNALLESTGRSHPPALGLALNRLLRFPPFWATILALITRPWDYPAWLSTGLSRLAQMLVPLALVSVGYQTRLHPTVLRRVAQPLARL